MDNDFSNLAPGVYLSYKGATKAITTQETWKDLFGFANTGDATASQIASTVAWVYSALQERQKTIGQIAYTWERNGEPIDDAALPFAFKTMDYAKRADKAIQTVGDSYLWKWRKDSRKIHELRWLDPRVVSPDSMSVQDGIGYTRYLYTTQAGVYAKQETLHHDDVVRTFVSGLNELDPDSSAADAYNLASQIIWGMDRTTDSFYDTNGLPAILVTVAKGTGPTAQKDTQAAFKRFFQKRADGKGNKVLAVPNEVTVEKLSFAPADLAQDTLSKRQIRAIYAANEVPLGFLNESGDHAKTLQDTKTFVLTMAARFQMLADELNEDADIKKAGLYLRILVSEHPSMQKDMALVADSVSKLTTNTTLTTEASLFLYGVTLDQFPEDMQVFKTADVAEVDPPAVVIEEAIKAIRPDGISYIYVESERNDIIQSYIDSGSERDVVTKYMESLMGHIENVQKAGAMIGVPEQQLRIHDASKFSVHEFMPYAQRFFGEPDEEAFQAAWLHHKNNNPHHWNHWLLDGEESTTVKMPDHYALEMVADWMGASKQYTGSWDMASWLSENAPHIKLHPPTRAYVTMVLNGLGYFDFRFQEATEAPPAVIVEKDDSELIAAEMKALRKFVKRGNHKKRTFSSKIIENRAIKAEITEQTQSEIDQISEDLQALVEQAARGEIEQEQFESEYIALFLLALTETAAAGAAGDLTADGAAQLATMESQARESVSNLSADIYAGRYSEGGINPLTPDAEPFNTASDGQIEGRGLDKIFNRVALWAGSLISAFSVGQAFSEANSEEKLMWVVGLTEHCSDCLRLDKQVHTAAEWAAVIQPQSPDLECQGYNCQCRLVDVPSDTPTSGGF